MNPPFPLIRNMFHKEALQSVITVLTVFNCKLVNLICTEKLVPSLCVNLITTLLKMQQRI